MAQRMNFEFALGKRARRQKRTDAEPLRVLVISDLRGDAAPRPDGLADARVLPISVDNFDQVVARLAPEARVGSHAGTHALQIPISAMSSFHPDSLVEQVELMRELRKSRERAQDARTFAAEPSHPLGLAGPGIPGAGGAESNPLSRLLMREVADTRSPAQAAASGALDDLLRSIVSKHVTHAPGPEQAQLLSTIDDALVAAMRLVLHAPELQRLEAAWRGLHWLTVHNAAGADMEVFVLAASRDELIADVRACAGELQRSQLYRAMLDEQPGGKGFALVLGDYVFEGSESDVSLLAALGATSAEAGGVFLAAAAPQLAGIPSLLRGERKPLAELNPVVHERMGLLRSSAVAPFIGLCMPRVLGRLPYGRRTDPTEQIAFEELSASPAHDELLWVNGAYACAQLIAAAFARDGWHVQLSDELELSDLPLVTLEVNGEPQLKPCAETYLDDRAAEHALEHGIMPLISHRQRNAVRLRAVRSIAADGTPLALPFSG